jgi:RimJ/RimL family protein N-acetyltransferase
VAAAPGDAADVFMGADMSQGGLKIFALPSRNRHGTPNVCLSVEDLPNQFALHESIDAIVTEQGVAHVAGRTVRERAQALIEIAHPEDRKELVDRAKEAHILYPDQIFLEESSHLYPSHIMREQTFKNETRVRFRALRPSDEEQMRRLFYRFSDEAVYYRFFSPIAAMPHARMQQYVNIDYRSALSIVGLVGDPGTGEIIAEGRFAGEPGNPWADLAFIVEDRYHGLGIATYMFELLVELARERGLKGFTADVLGTNKPMLRVIEKVGLPVKTLMEGGAFHMEISLDR